MPSCRDHPKNTFVAVVVIVVVVVLAHVETYCSFLYHVPLACDGLVFVCVTEKSFFAFYLHNADKTASVHRVAYIAE